MNEVEMQGERILLAMDTYELRIRELRIRRECRLISQAEYDRQQVTLANEVRVACGEPPLPAPPENIA